MKRSKLFYVVLTFVYMQCVTGSADEPLFPNSDFETGTLENWTAKGEAFKFQPTFGDNSKIRHSQPSKLQGQWWIGGYEKYTKAVGKPGDMGGDKPKGTLTSTEFEIKQPFITFRIGGGNHPGVVGVNLLVDGEKVELSSGVNNEMMVQLSVDVKKHIGKTAQIEVFDNHSGGWGHINVDDFRETEKAVPLTDEVKAMFTSSWNISPKAYPEVGYDQANRPQFHFVSRKNWINDPNGMVFDGQKYHLFFQHNPLGTGWGNMTWGHATSTDMIHWKQLDHALLPYRVDGRGGTVYSGTAVVDHNNSLRKQVGDTKTLCAFYTYASDPKFYQAMAYSTDSGETWTYWNEGRAVVPHQGFDQGERDPKVFWHEESQQWVMVLWVSRNPGRVRFFTSKNLTDWKFASDLMRDWAYECIDLVFLPVDDDPKNIKCVIYDASFDYEVGTFDGKQFHAQSPKRVLAGGSNFYAAQTFNSAPDNRVVQIGWMRGGPNSSRNFGVPHNQQMSFPCELKLRTTPEGVKLFCWPIKEIESLVTPIRTFESSEFAEQVNVIASIGELDLIDIDFTFEPGDAKEVVIALPRVTLNYNAETGELKHAGVRNDGQPAIATTMRGLKPREGKVSLRVLVDRLSVEVFAFGGEKFAAYYIYPDHKPAAPSLHSVGGGFKLNSLEVRSLKSAWSAP